MRCLLRTLGKKNCPGWRQYKQQYKKLRSLYRVAQKLRPSRSKDNDKVEARASLIRERYTDFITCATSLLSHAEQTLSTEALSPSIVAVCHDYSTHAHRQIDQLSRRVLHGETIPHEEKVFSIFETHTEWICKGKAGVPVELGLRTGIVEDQYGFIINYRVMQGETDDQAAIPFIQDTKDRFPLMKSCSFDKGFYSPNNRAVLSELLEVAAMPKKGKLSSADKELQQSDAFKQARKKHAAVESAINALEVHGLDRCSDRGINGFRRYVGVAILARNIYQIGRILHKREQQALKRRKQLKVV